MGLSARRAGVAIACVAATAGLEPARRHQLAMCPAWRDRAGHGPIGPPIPLLDSGRAVSVAPRGREPSGAPRGWVMSPFAAAKGLCLCRSTLERRLCVHLVGLLVQLLRALAERVAVASLLGLLNLVEQAADVAGLVREVAVW